jgi:thiol:disulfide interchange protein DsbD
MNNFLKGLEIYLQGAPHLAYLAVFVGGLLTSFTPCIYPLFPILVGYIGGRGEHKKSRSFIMSLVYVIGMAITYAALGAVAALTGKLFGEIQSNPWVYLVIANIIILMGLSMLGVFTLTVPVFLQNLQKGRDKKGMLGPFLLGLSSGLIAAPCTAAVLGVVLTFVATKQNVLFGVTLLFVYALGAGALLLIAGTFTGFLLALPKPGTWTNVIQKIFGWFMIALGEYFLFRAGMLFI